VNAKWKFGQLVELTNLSECLTKSSVQASVLDYITKHTEQGGRPVQEPDKKHSRVAWKEKKFVVSVPYVFTMLNWVESV